MYRCRTIASAVPQPLNRVLHQTFPPLAWATTPPVKHATQTPKEWKQQQRPNRQPLGSDYRYMSSICKLAIAVSSTSSFIYWPFRARNTHADAKKKHFPSIHERPTVYDTPRIQLSIR